MTAGALLERGSFVALGVEAAAFASVDLTLTGAGVLVTNVSALSHSGSRSARPPFVDLLGKVHKFVARVYDAFGVGCVFDGVVFDSRVDHPDDLDDRLASG